MNPELDYQTTDIGCASHLIVSGIPLTKIEHKQKRSIFLFPLEAKPRAEDYWNDAALSNPRKLIMVLRDLKARLRNEREMIGERE